MRLVRVSFWHAAIAVAVYGSVFLGLVVQSSAQAPPDADKSDPPIKRGSDRKLLQVRGMEKPLDNKGDHDGEVVWTEWWYYYRALDGLRLVGIAQMTVRPNFPGNSGNLEDIVLGLGHTYPCTYRASDPDPNSPGLQLQAGLTATPEGLELGVGIAGTVAADGTLVQEVRVGPNTVEWLVDISDGSGTARKGVDELLFFAEWGCPETNFETWTGVGRALVQIDGWGRDTDYWIYPERQLVSTCQPEPYKPPMKPPPLRSATADQHSCRDLPNDDLTRKMASLLPSPTPSEANALAQTAHVVAPDVAASGGTIYGMVVDNEGEPVADAPVQLTTLSGTIIETQTDKDGQFASRVPGGEKSLGLSLRGAAQKITVNVAENLAQRLLSRPPDLLQAGSLVKLQGSYPSVKLEPITGEVPATGTSSTTPMAGSNTGMGATPATGTASGPPTAGTATGSAGRVSVPGGRPEAARTGMPMQPRPEVVAAPVGLSTSKDGASAITVFEVPRSLRVGPVRTVLVGNDGLQRQFTSRVFHMSGTLDQRTLRTGQAAEFVYTFDFGPGPKREAWISVATTGPIQLLGSNQPQRLQIDSSGKAEFRGKIKAQKGTLTGAPFSITPALSQSRQ